MIMNTLKMKNQLFISKGRIVDFGVLTSPLRFFMIVIIIIISLGSGVTYESLGNGSKVTFTISHWNDFNGQFERFKFSEGLPHPCQAEDIDSIEYKCIGDFASFANIVTQPALKIKKTNNLVLTPGNFLGTKNGWLSSLVLSKSNLSFLENSPESNPFKAYGTLMKKYLNPNAMTVGYEDLRYGWENISKFLSGLDPKPVIISNFNKSLIGNPLVRNNFHVEPFHIHNLKLDDSEKDFPLLILGYVQPSLAEHLSPYNPKLFNEVIPSLQSAIKKAKMSLEKHTINTVVVLGNGDFDLSKQIIDEIPEVKIIISGDLDYFKSTENSESHYPLEYKQGLIAVAGKYGSSVGKLVISIDTRTGNILEQNGTLVPNMLTPLTNENAKKDISTLKRLVKNQTSNVIGHSEFGIKGGSACSKMGCVLGNVIADAMARCFFHDQVSARDGHSTMSAFSSRVLAVFDAGSMTNYDYSVPRFQEIWEIDVYKWLPYMESAELILIRGSILTKLFEISASTLGKYNDTFGYFLHVSSDMKVHYVERENPKSGTLKKLLIASYNPEDEFLFEFQEIDPLSEYSVVIPLKILEGMGPYGFMKDAIENEDVKKPSTSFIKANTLCLLNYIKKEELLTTGFEPRIFIEIEDHSFFKNGLGYKTLILILTVLLVLETLYLFYWSETPLKQSLFCYSKPRINHKRFSNEYQSPEYFDRENIAEFDMEELPYRNGIGDLEK